MFISRSQNWNLENHYPLQIKIVGGYWSDAKIEDIRCLLENVAQCILQHFENPVAACIFVECHPSRPTPEVQCRNSSTNEHFISLTTQDYRRWAYQFAHEFCHVLSGHERLRCLPNKWFHEAFCELASIFVIRQMAKGQSISIWENSSIAFQSYAELLVSYSDFQLPSNTILPEWFKANEQSLRANPYQRDKNGIVALRLLPLIESNPKYWQSICFISDSMESFENFFGEWCKNCPQQQKPFIAQIADLFNLSLKTRLARLRF
jgi:hypothetical protein